ncbi:hypothetical protein Gogos_018395, partial [Gossypium gossypioides]|nr:hypothetical protein [Gossypium gossypioides]
MLLMEVFKYKLLSRHYIFVEFTYNKGQHNVFEVTESTYRTCDASSGVLAKYESGDDKVELTKSKKYWFICNVSGHCLGGMRFGVDVKAGNTSSTNLDPTPSANSGNALDTWSLGIQSYKVQSPFFCHAELEEGHPKCCFGNWNGDCGAAND